MTPMEWLLEKARTTPRTFPHHLSGQIVGEMQLWTDVEDNQRIIQQERPTAPLHVVQYLAERRTYADFWGTKDLHMFPESATTLIHHQSQPADPSFVPNTPQSTNASLNPTLRGRRDEGNNERTRMRSRSPPRREHSSYWRPADEPRRLRDYRSRSPERRLNPSSEQRSWSQRAQQTSQQYQTDPLRLATRPDPYVDADAQPVLGREPPRNYDDTSCRSCGTSFRSNNQFHIHIREGCSGPGRRSQCASVREDIQDQTATGLNRNTANVLDRNNLPRGALVFTDPRAYDKIGGGPGFPALKEVNGFFPAVVFQLQKLPPHPDAPSESGLAVLWLEYNTSSDPSNNGVRWQYNACLAGLTEYQRRVFHHDKTNQGRYLQTARKPRSSQELQRQQQPALRMNQPMTNPAAPFGAPSGPKHAYNQVGATTSLRNVSGKLINGRFIIDLPGGQKSGDERAGRLSPMAKLEVVGGSGEKAKNDSVAKWLKDATS